MTDVRSLRNGHNSGSSRLQELDVRCRDVHGLVGLRRSDTLRQNPCAEVNKQRSQQRVAQTKARASCVPVAKLTDDGSEVPAGAFRGRGKAPRDQNTTTQLQQ